MDLQDIEAIVECIQDTHITEIEIQEGKTAVRIARTPVYVPEVIQAVALPAEANTTEEPAEMGQMIRSQMVGMVYLSPASGQKNYVEVGQSVKVGDVICHIEVMQMLHKVEADKAGKITAVLVENGTPTEYNQPLFMIEV